MTQKYRHTFRCECGSTFKKISTKPDLKEAVCPHCKKKESERRYAIGDGAVSDQDILPPIQFIRTDKYNCNSCNKLLIFRVEKEGDEMSHCYKCGSQDIKYIGQHLVHAQPGNRDAIKALDIVAHDTMKHYAMTDVNLNSNMRAGDSCAPKLPPSQQRMVDGFFNHSKNPLGARAAQIGRAAIAGAYRDPTNPVAMVHASKMRPAIDGKYIDATPGRKPN